jgi:hypothetical protein
MKRLTDVMLPIVTLFLFATLWEFGVRWANIPAYTLPAPSVILHSLIVNWTSLAASWWFTLQITFGALLLVAGHGMMAFEGRPATETLTYAGTAYEISAEGRGASRDVNIVALRALRVGITQSNMSMPRAMPSSRSSGVPTPIR